MRPLTDREKRTVRFAGIGIAIYLALFGGLQVWKFLEKRRSDYRQLAAEAQQLRQKIQQYQDKAQVVKKLMDDFHLDPAKLKKETVVSDASAAIQKAAKSGGLQLGPIRESPAHGAGMTLATVQLETSGQVPAVLAFLAGLNNIGFPVVVDSVQFTADNSRPGQVKMNLTLIILDFDQQKEVPHA
jgi:Tfp pilus assembly protein PilN